MKIYQFLIQGQFQGTVLYLIIIAAGIDYVGIIDYGLKALVGSVVWFGFRVLGDYYTQKIKFYHNNKSKQKEK